MERKLASIQVIAELRPIPDADAILCAKVLGWECVVKLNEFKVGDKCVFFEIDSILPIAPWNEHLRKGSEKDKPLRIRSIRLRKTLSQGLALPLNLLPEGIYEAGQDVTGLVGVQKYETIIPAELQGKVKGNRPVWCPKTDELRGASFPDVIPEVLGLNVEVVGTIIKMDGASVSCYLRNGVFGVTSRNMELIETPDNAYWKAVRAANVENKMRSYFKDGDNYVVAGELCGPGIQGNRAGLDKLTIFWFNLYNIDSASYCSTKELLAFTNASELNMVPVYFMGKFPVDTALATLQEMSNNLNYANGLPAEGIVWRPIEETYSEVLKGRLSFKVVSSRYLLTYRE
jgi:RNA ligase (TIGR02306 family)